MSKILEERYKTLCCTESDIKGHLPRMVDLVEQLNAQHVIELGTRGGVSTIAWLHGLVKTGGRLTSVDLDPKPDIGDFDHWTFIQGDDLDPTILGQIDQADIVFVDTSHLYHQTRAELDAYRCKVKTGGVICLHDTELKWPTGASPVDGPYPVKRAVMEFVRRHQCQIIHHPDYWGFSIVKAGDL